MKPSQDDPSSSLLSSTNLEPVTGLTPTFPLIPPLSLGSDPEWFTLPLSREMSLYGILYLWIPRWLTFFVDVFKLS